MSEDGSRLAGFDCSGPQRPPLVSNSLAAPGTYNPDDCLGGLSLHRNAFFLTCFSLDS